ncbi:hypothetical protein IMSAGC012_02416 [Lachnospiraceae bacterium]|jgi:hypothetical protein|nr:hypothetical protein IMSAGC012_02416 [Lachnospiraceae bacterium]
MVEACKKIEEKRTRDILKADRTAAHLKTGDKDINGEK